MSAVLFSCLPVLAAHAKEDAADFIGIFAPNDEIEPIFKVVRENGRLLVSIEKDDESCGWLPLIDADGNVEQARLADRAELSKLLGRSAPEQVQAIVIDGWGVIYHAPKGWRLNGNFATQTGFFLTFKSSGEGMSSPGDFHKVSPESVCP
ncbi:hypothetical protein [Dyella tabacisoli]|uniref:Uncharacterized protein n=1 Tax=Dyella tabacisoli TaxID=2282381 RepID=A0A369UQR6_9GAMM|nr:hypothetical protein [Dyella tabacisoli]RDD80669.1 hypothetical protein DVJ77_15655 [Dyella tabacisoli]